MIRETISGAVTECSKFYVPEGTRPRSSRRGKSSPRKQDNNDRDAVKRLARILNCNFRAGDALVTLTYAAETERAEGEKRVKNFLRRLKRQAEKAGLTFRWVLVSSEQTDEGEQARLHHHLVLSGDLLRFDGQERRWYIGKQPAEEAWGLGWADVRTLRDQKDYTPVAVYLVRQARREPDAKKYRCSRNLCHPAPVGERIVKPGHQPWIPRGAVVLERSEYTQESPCQYVRYLLPEKPTGRGSPPEQRKNRKETKKNGE